MEWLILAFLVLCALAVLTQRPAPPTVVIVEHTPAAPSFGCGGALLIAAVLLVALALAS